MASTPDCSTRACCFRVAQVGFEPTASKDLSRGGLPVAYRAVCLVSTQSRTRTCKRPGLSGTALPIGVSGHRVAEVVPDGIEPSFPGCEPSVVAVGPRDYVRKWTHPELHRDLWHATPASSCWTMSPSYGAEAVRLELTNDFSSPPVFKTGSSSSRMTSVL